MGIRRAVYDTQEFRDRWYAGETLASLSEWLGVTEVAIWIAARRRGFPGKWELRAR